MTVRAPADTGSATPEPDAGPPERSRLELRVASAAMALLPGGLIVYFGFTSGGFFPGSVGFAAALVAQMLVVRVLLADHPFAGFSRPLLAVTAAFGLYTGWILASGLWSASADRPLIEFDRALLYLLLLVLMGTLPRRVWRAAWLARGIVAGAFVVCASGLITRVLPHLWPVAPGIANNRLSYPVSYWNALGLLATIGTLIALGLAANDRETRLGRALPAATVPVFAATLLFTFSRGSILALAFGFAVYVCVARQRSLLPALLAVLPPTIVALVIAYNADQLATFNATSPTAVHQGKGVAVAVLICALAAGVVRWLLAPVDRRLAGIRVSAHVRRRARIGAGALAAGLIVVALALGGASWVDRQWNRFIGGAAVSGQDQRARLTDPSLNGRTQHWRVAFKGFAGDRLKGHGGGSYQFQWEKSRTVAFAVTDAHGLYFEVPSEYGLIGLVLLVGTLAAILRTLLRRRSGVNSGYWAALLAASAAWALHAGVDWDWEMPVITAWVFAVGGAALASRLRPQSSEAPILSSAVRIPIAAVLLLATLVPVLLMISQSHLSRSANARAQGNCSTARSEAFAAISALAVRPEPYHILGYCDMAQGRSKAAVAAMTKAIEREPDSWEYRFGLALARAQGGADPRPDIAAAAGRNPLEPLVQQAKAAFATNRSASGWQAASDQIRLQALQSGRLTFR
jgi:hypothetical protein